MYSTTDTNITCADCKNEFVFTASEQQFFAERGFSTPRRCKSCRELAKMARSEGGGSYGGGGASRSSTRQMHDVTCDQCGVQTQVPFKPSSGKPVYCRDCFRR